MSQPLPVPCPHDRYREVEHCAVCDADEELAEANRIIGQQGLELIARAEELKLAWNVARHCWQEWRLYADLGRPPGTSEGAHRALQLAERFPQLKEPQAETLMDLLQEDYQVGTSAGPQVVVSLRSAEDGDEQVFRTDNFETAHAEWRRRQKEIGPGGYALWINAGDIWRASGLLDDMDRARAIRNRILTPEEPGG